jgi:dipeptidyl aminopeptidase/acylaminoacyl peptidase
MLTPDLFKCAISVNGVSDRPGFLDHRIKSFGSKSITADYWQMSIGDRNDDRASIRAASPAQNAAKIIAPVLLMHGTQDSVVPIQQSRLMQRRLGEDGKTSTFVELTGDDHWLSDAATRTQMLEASETFLAKHLK